MSCSAYLTACNLYSQSLDDAANARRQAALVAALEQRGVPWQPGIGEHPINGWTGEPSVLALGVGREAAIELGREHRQHAVVWSGADGGPELLLLSPVQR